jgi:O-antigen/teichoic acid export membrane protein
LNKLDGADNEKKVDLLDDLLPVPASELASPDADLDATDQLPRIPKRTKVHSEEEVAFDSMETWVIPAVDLKRSRKEENVLADMETWVIPVVKLENNKKSAREPSGAGKEILVLRKLIMHSGIYAISSITGPLISLVLAPFLTHNLTPASYGALAVINIAITLSTGITQLGLYSAFFRAYSYDYTDRQDRRDVVATVTSLILLVSTAVALVVILVAPWFASLFFGQSLFGKSIALAGAVVLLQNLTIPGLAWLRAEERPWLFSLLSISNLLVTLLGNLLLVGMWHWGIEGSIIANGSGFACIVAFTFPVILIRAGLKVRLDVAKGLLAFGLPLVLNSIAYWVLQLSDRYLLSLFVSFDWTARYTVAYMLGSALSIVVVNPFTLAWPTAMFAIAKRKNAPEIFRLVFRWLSMVLLFAAFSLSLIGVLVLNWLFPVTYHQAASIIPIVAASLVLYGIYYVFMVGANITRKTWLAAVFTTFAALINVAANLVLIPLYGAIGAAISTFIAFVMLAVVAYIANQQIYPLPFEVLRLVLGFCLGVALYVGSNYITQSQTISMTWSIYLATLVLYGSCLALIGNLPTLRQKVRAGELVQ